MVARPSPARCTADRLTVALSRSLVAGLLLFSLSCSAGTAQTSLSRSGLERSLDCGSAATPIHDIQGNGSVSPLIGQIRTVEAVVVGDFQESDELNGFFLQEEDVEADGDALTSEGIFVFESGSTVDVAVGDLVRVTGTVAEFPDDEIEKLTQLNEVTSVVVCSSANPLPQATDVDLPLGDVGELERLEGMRVRLPQALRVTGTFNLGSFGEALLSWNATEPFQFVPTERHPPGSLEAQALADLQTRSRVLLDDGRTESNPDPIPLASAFSPETLRRGDTLSEPLEAILSSGFGRHRLQPTKTPKFSRSDPRPTSPPDVGGELRVAAANVLNFFTTLDDGTNRARGADSLAEYQRQRDKLVAMLCALEADVVALSEVENNGDLGASSAIGTLAATVNTGCGLGYQWIDTGITGTTGNVAPDAITNGLLYRPATVTPAGNLARLETGTFDGLSRPPIAQAFRSTLDPEAPSFVVVANHFKSKGGCPPAPDADADQGDGQGCWNATRVRSAQALLAWLATDPTGTGTERTLVLGDLNAYSREAPIATLVDGGLVDLLDDLATADRYTYVFGGEAGVLDHALATPTLASEVTGAAVWHVNADEPRALDYEDAVADSSTFPDRLNADSSLYRPDPFRAADHDPVVVGLTPRSSTIFADDFESGSTNAWAAGAP